LALVDDELLAVGFEAGEPVGELLDALAAGMVGYRAGLESAEVALERGVRLADLGVDSLQLGFSLRALLVELGECFPDRVADDRFLLEDCDESLKDRVVEPLGGQPVGVAALLAVALAGEADVVGVAPAVGGGADVALAAAPAADQAGEQVVRLVRAPQRRILAALLRIACARSKSAFSTSRSCGAG
jgi:hypothetical protein